MILRVIHKSKNLLTLGREGIGIPNVECVRPPIQTRHHNNPQKQTKTSPTKNIERIPQNNRISKPMTQHHSEKKNPTKLEHPIYYNHPTAMTGVHPTIYKIHKINNHRSTIELFLTPDNIENPNSYCVIITRRDKIITFEDHNNYFFSMLHPSIASTNIRITVLNNAQTPSQLKTLNEYLKTIEHLNQ